MVIRILGRLEVLEDGRALELGGSKERALLAVLVLHANSTVSTDRLINALWHSPPATARKVLQVYVSHLRKTIGAERIVTRAPGYRLRTEEEDDLDVARFERLVADAHAAEPLDAARTLREALALWRGAPLAEFEREPFAEVERLRLADLHLSALEARIDADLRLGRAAELLPELDVLVLEHPFRERLSAQRMLALYRSGRQAEALEQYRRTRRLLIDDVGLEPGPELQQLERAILAQDDSLTAPADGAPRAASPELPTGTVTLLFTDIEGSTALLRRSGDRYGDVVAEHQRLLRHAFEKWRGTEIDSQGDSFFAVFHRAKDAVAAAVAAQLALSSHEWREGAEVRVRIGIHTGEPAVGGDRYFGLGVHRAARIMAAAHGGQILVSQATRELLADDPPSGAVLVDLGQHQLRDFEGPERLYQVAADGLAEEFPPLRTSPSTDARFAAREAKLVNAAEAALARRRSRRRLGVMLAVVAAAVSAVVAVFLVDRAVGPDALDPVVMANSVVAVHPGDLDVTDAIGVGRAPGPMAIQGSRLWIGNTASTTLTEIDVRRRQVRTTLGLPRPPWRLVAGAGALWIGNAFDGTVSRLELASGLLSRAFRPQPRSVGRLALATGVGSLWVGSQDDVVVRVDPETLETEATIRGVENPASLVVAEGAVWVIEAGRADVLRIEAKTNRVLGRIPLGGIPTAIAADDRNVWVLGGEERKLWRIDPKTSTIKEVIALGPTPISPSHDALAAGEGSVWVAGAGANGMLVQVDPDSDPVIRTLRIGRRLAGVAVGANSVWVSVR